MSFKTGSDFETRAGAIAQAAGLALAAGSRDLIFASLAQKLGPVSAGSNDARLLAYEALAAGLAASRAPAAARAPAAGKKKTTARKKTTAKKKRAGK